MSGSACLQQLSLRGAIMRHMRAFICALVLCHVCIAQAVKVRVINGYDGRPPANNSYLFEVYSYEPSNTSFPPLFYTDSTCHRQFNIAESTAKKAAPCLT